MKYIPLFDGHAATLGSHRGWDPGALLLAKQCARHFGAPLIASTVSRLLVELNRSPGHPQQFSEMTRGLGDEQRQKIVDRYYTPYRAKVTEAVLEATRRGDTVLHLSVHSFTPVLDGTLRDADIGLLFDPDHALESQICTRWMQALEATKQYRVRLNYPYHGADDGLTTHLRKITPQDRYAGIEIEVNQSFPLAGSRSRWLRLRNDVVNTYAAALRATSS